MDSNKKARIVSSLIPCLVLLNIFDAGSTMYSLHAKIATEANPIMAFFYNVSPWAFLFVKLFLTFYGGLVISYHKQEPWAFKVSVILVVLFVLLAIYQGVSIVLLSSSL